jgi:asparagine synthase (glutamine-hydrolysing)
MNRQLRHRGPDDEGVFISRNVGLAMRRLSIIDLETGHQPISNEDESIWIVYNGEIYNYRDLRSKLAARGHHLRTKSDTETVVHLYEDLGKSCVHHLRGMFAFALWDEHRRKLVLARDRLGIKPLYYRLNDHELVFASEIKAILAYPGVKPALDSCRLPKYLSFGYVGGSGTLFRDIQVLPPGHTLVIDDEGVARAEEYWDLSFAPDGHSREEKYYADAYRGMLEEAVSSHMISDVPLGVFLSGGIDSSAVAAMMTRAQRGTIKTFSVGYEEAADSELSYANTVARHLKTDHHEVKIGREDFFQALPRLIWHEDKPIVWPSSIPLYFVARLAREHVVVVLTGEGSDETLGGYSRYPYTLWNARLDRAYRRLTPSSLRRLIRSQVAESPMIRADLRRRLQHTFVGRDLEDWPSCYFEDFYAAFSESQQVDLLNDDISPAPGAAYADMMRRWEDSSGDSLSRLLYTDIKTYLVELLMKQDRMSMAASVESRVPFLDHVLVEFAATIPAPFKVRGLSGKHVLKKAVRDLLPDSVLDRKKMGFPTPIRLWLRGPHLDTVERLLLSQRSRDRALFKERSLQRIFREHRSLSKDHTDRIWRLLCLEHWCRIFLDGDSAPEIRPVGI